MKKAEVDALTKRLEQYGLSQSTARQVTLEVMQAIVDDMIKCGKAVRFDTVMPAAARLLAARIEYAMVFVGTVSD